MKITLGNMAAKFDAGLVNLGYLGLRRGGWYLGWGSSGGGGRCGELVTLPSPWSLSADSD